MATVTSQLDEWERQRCEIYTRVYRERVHFEERKAQDGGSAS